MENYVLGFRIDEVFNFVRLNTGSGEDNLTIIFKQLNNPASETLQHLNGDLVNKIAKGLGLAFVPQAAKGNVCFANNNSELRDDFKQVFAPLDLLNYSYAVLHSPTYRERYKAFLKTDTPRVPYPKDKDAFWELAALGKQLRQGQLSESAETRLMKKIDSCLFKFNL